MSLSLECYWCKKFFPIIIVKNIFYYNTKIKVKIKVYQHSNVQQQIDTIYFCTKKCKKEYLNKILEKKYK